MMRKIQNIAKGVFAKLCEDKEMAFASRFLAEINKNAPINMNLCDFEYGGINKSELCALCEDLELNSIITRLGLRECDDNVSMFETEILDCNEILSVDEIGTNDFSCIFDEEFIYACNNSDTVYKLPLNAENMQKIADKTLDKLGVQFEKEEEKSAVHEEKVMEDDNEFAL